MEAGCLISWTWIAQTGIVLAAFACQHEPAWLAPASAAMRAKCGHPAAQSAKGQPCRFTKVSLQATPLTVQAAGRLGPLHFSHAPYAKCKAWTVQCRKHSKDEPRPATRSKSWASARRVPQRRSATSVAPEKAWPRRRVLPASSECTSSRPRLASPAVFLSSSQSVPTMAASTEAHCLLPILPVRTENPTFCVSQVLPLSS